MRAVKSRKVDNRNMDEAEALYNKPLLEEIKERKRIMMMRNIEAAS